MSGTLSGSGRATPKAAIRCGRAREIALTDIAERLAASVWPGLFAAMRRPGVAYGRPWIGWILPAIIMVAWQAFASLGWIPDTVMPSPYAVVAAAWRLTLSGELPQNLGVSA